MGSPVLSPNLMGATDTVYQCARQVKCSVKIRPHQGLFSRSLFLGQRIPLAGVAHQNGTIRFGTDPKASALDVNCKAHDVDNLYVVDGAFFLLIVRCKPGVSGHGERNTRRRSFARTDVMKKSMFLLELFCGAFGEMGNL
jgi:hypothetical protein